MRRRFKSLRFIGVVGITLAMQCACTPGATVAYNMVFERGNDIWAGNWGAKGFESMVIANGARPQWMPAPNDTTNTTSRKTFAFVRLKVPGAGGQTEAAIFTATRPATTGADFNQVTQLTDFDSGEDFSWSPDGQWITFQSFRDGHWEIYKMQADGSNQTRLTTSQQGVKNLKPRWSPKGGWIAFQSNQRNGKWDVWVMGVNGQGQRNLTAFLPEDGYDGDATWSSDDTHLAHITIHSNWGNLEQKLAITDLATPINNWSLAQVGGDVASQIIWDHTWGDQVYFFRANPLPLTLYAYNITSNQATALCPLGTGTSLFGSTAWWLNLLFYSRQDPADGHIYIFSHDSNPGGADVQIVEGVNPSLAGPIVAAEAPAGGEKKRSISKTSFGKR
jgi:hypothetical protein